MKVQLYLKRKSKFPVTQFAVSGATKLHKETKLHLIFLFFHFARVAAFEFKTSATVSDTIHYLLFYHRHAAPSPKRPGGRGRVSDVPASDSQDKGGSSSKQPPHVTFTSPTSKTL